MERKQGIQQEVGQSSNSFTIPSVEIELTEVIPIRSVTTIVDGIRETTVLDIEPLPSPPQPALLPQPTNHCTVSSGNEVSVTNENSTVMGLQHNVHFLEIYWRMIKFPETNEDKNEKLATAMNILWKFCWILLVVLTTLDTLSNIKDSLLDIKVETSNDEIVVDRTQAKLVTLAYRIAQLLLKIVFIHTATKRSHITADAFKHLHSRNHQNLECIPVVAITTTVAVSLGCVLGCLGVLQLDEKWSLNEIMRIHFENTYNRIMVWHPSEEDHGTNSPFLFYGGAAIGYMMHFASRLVELSIQSLLLLTAISFLLEVKKASGHLTTFNTTIKNANSEDGSNEKLIDLGEKIMAEYENQRDLTKAMNGAFGMFSFIHCTNLTLFVFWGHSAYTEFDIGEFTWAGIEVGMFGTSYFFAIYVAIVAAGYEEWILNKRTQDVMKIYCTRLQSLLHEMKNSPIGIGSGILYVNQDFIVKFAVLSFQAFMVLLRALANHST